MAGTIFNPAQLNELVDRLGRLTPDAERRWGKMTAPRMVCHLRDSLDVVTGVRPAKPKGKAVLKHPITRFLVLYVIPWPKGKVETAPEMLVTQPGDWKNDVSALQSQVKSAAQRGASGEWAEHPAFGNLSGKDYGVLIYRHFSHHLTQFGV